MEQMFYRSNYPYATSKNQAHKLIFDSGNGCVILPVTYAKKGDVSMYMGRMYCTADFSSFLEFWDQEYWEQATVTISVEWHTVYTVPWRRGMW